MIRNCSLEEISDGKLYEVNDMVKASCNDCEGCSACCKGMGNSIVLDPLDVYRLMTGLSKTFEELLANEIELNVVDGVILPNIKMASEQEQCNYLDENGRCSIHSIRPGICRIFPLGRYYENNDFKYILQVNECKKESRTKVKVSKWIDTPNVKENHEYIVQWHYFLKQLQELIQETEDEAQIRTMNLYVLNLFFVTPYEPNRDFYIQFQERLTKMKMILG